MRGVAESSVNYRNKKEDKSKVLTVKEKSFNEEEQYFRVAVDGKIMVIGSLDFVACGV